MPYIENMYNWISDYKNTVTIKAKSEEKKLVWINVKYK